jgi:hypothetical protein
MRPKHPALDHWELSTSLITGCLGKRPDRNQVGVVPASGWRPSTCLAARGNAWCATMPIPALGYPLAPAALRPDHLTMYHGHGWRYWWEQRLDRVSGGGGGGEQREATHEHVAYRAAGRNWNWL